MAIDFKPHSYQKYAIDKVIDNEKYGLFLDMGLGKTVSTLTAFSELQLLDTKKMLVIAPKQVAKDTWVDEVDKWNHLNHLKVSLVLGTPKERNDALNTEADIYVTNKENTKWLCDQYKKEWPFDMVVIDELSTFKRPKSQRFKSIKKKLPLINRFIGLTGTPSPNSLQDLWAQVYLIDRVDTKQTVVLSEKERKVYEELEKNYILESEEEGTVVAQNGASLSQKLLQLSNGAVYTDEEDVRLIHDKKLDKLEEIIEESQGQPILLFYNFKHDKERILQRFKEATTLEDSNYKERWNSGDIKLLIAHPASAGHGLNLQQGGHIIVWFGLTWSLELYQQANARLYRQGQNHTTIIHHIMTDNTIDQRVYKALQNKELTQEELMKAIKARIAKHK